MRPGSAAGCNSSAGPGDRREMLARRVTVSRGPCRHLLPIDNAEQWDVSPGVLATRLAARPVVLAGRAARRSRANVRHPAAAQAPTAQPFALDGLPGTQRAGHGRWRRSSTRRRRVLLRWQAPQPWRSRSGATVTEAVDPYAGPYAEPYAGPCATATRPRRSPPASRPRSSVNGSGTRRSPSRWIPTANVLPGLDERAAATVARLILEGHESEPSGSIDKPLTTGRVVPSTLDSAEGGEARNARSDAQRRRTGIEPA
jgi:hypothetical protein